MTFQNGQRVRINSGQHYGLVGIYRGRHGACAHLVELPGWGCVDCYSVLDIHANNGD